MKIGIIGVGMVGGALSRWLKKNTPHKVVHYDPFKNMQDDFSKAQAIFITIPIYSERLGQDLKVLRESLAYANRYTNKIFIRSTVLPGTCDMLKCISSPEFLTARRPDEDMEKLDVLVGECDLGFAKDIFIGKNIIQMKNKEAELAKLMHNCFGAMKVTYFNTIFNLCKKFGISYNQVLKGIDITGFINKEHTRVPGPDGLNGYGGTCFPENMNAMKEFFERIRFDDEQKLFEQIMKLNQTYRYTE
jgi:UDP-glucose 6-dehydrogenase